MEVFRAFFCTFFRHSIDATAGFSGAVVTGNGVVVSVVTHCPDIAPVTFGALAGSNFTFVQSKESFTGGVYFKKSVLLPVVPSLKTNLFPSNQVANLGVSRNPRDDLVLKVVCCGASGAILF